MGVCVGCYTVDMLDWMGLVISIFLGEGSRYRDLDSVYGWLAGW